ncbi:hypothetical protein ACTXT7_000180 [Hymenolepis weldensis]
MYFKDGDEYQEVEKENIRLRLTAIRFTVLLKFPYGGDLVLHRQELTLLAVPAMIAPISKEALGIKESLKSVFIKHK